MSGLWIFTTEGRGRVRGLTRLPVARRSKFENEVPCHAYILCGSLQNRMLSRSERHFQAHSTVELSKI
jgi:hypothetical protein